MQTAKLFRSIFEFSPLFLFLASSGRWPRRVRRVRAILLDLIIYIVYAASRFGER